MFSLIGDTMSNCLYLSDIEFEKLLKQYEYKFSKGDFVKGIVTGYAPDGVLVNIGAKNDAIVPTYEAITDSEQKPETNLLIGNEYEFVVINEEDEDSRFTLSYKKVAQAYIWKELEELKKSDAIVAGKICNMVRGGLLVDVGGLKGFVPLSHLSLPESELVEGNEIELKILTVDQKANNFVLSNKKIQTETQNKNKLEAFSKLEVGKVVEGEVVRVTDFGAFVDVNGIDGLLPLSQISWKWVEHPKDILSVGQKIQVEIVSLESSKLRVNLSHKTLKADPWIGIENQLSEGKKVKGLITRIKHFGAFVEIIEGVEALLPMSEINDYQRKNDKNFEVSDEVLCTISKLNLNQRRISLSLKDC